MQCNTNTQPSCRPLCCGWRTWRIVGLPAIFSKVRVTLHLGIKEVSFAADVMRTKVDRKRSCWDDIIDRWLNTTTTEKVRRLFRCILSENFRKRDVSFRHFKCRMNSHPAGWRRWHFLLSDFLTTSASALPSPMMFPKLLSSSYILVLFIMNFNEWPAGILPKIYLVPAEAKRRLKTARS
jgi:hypothetical protein